LSLLERYILREHLVPFLLGFLVVIFLLSLNFLFEYMDLFINKRVPALVVLELYFLGTGWMIALAVPCACLVASLMTFGRMAQDNEVTALRAAGVHLATAMRLPLAAAVAVAIGLTLFNNHILPETNHAFANLMIDIAKKRPAIEIQEGVFINDFPGYSILIGRLDHATSRMEHVTIYELKPRGLPTTIIAKSGRLWYAEDGATLTLELEDGEIHEVPAGRTAGKYRRLAFKRHVIHIAGVGSELERTARTTRSDREMSARDMRQEIAKLETRRRGVLADLDTTVAQAGYPSFAEARKALSPGPQGLPRVAGWLGGIFAGGPIEPPRTEPAIKTTLPANVAAKLQVKEVELKAINRRINSFRVEIHKKFSIPVACVVFVLVGAPLGIRARRGGVAIGFLSVAFFLFYYICLIGGEQLADRSLLPPWLAMWIADVVLGVLGVIFMLRAVEFSPAAAEDYRLAQARSARARPFSWPGAPTAATAGEPREKAGGA
jgi:lipopolysaccharide export system permease protein